MKIYNISEAVACAEAFKNFRNIIKMFSDNGINPDSKTIIELLNGQIAVYEKVADMLLEEMAQEN